MPTPIKKRVAIRFSKNAWIALGLFILACLTRIIFLGKAELWCDEIIYINRSSPPLTPWSLLTNRLEHFSTLSYMPLPGMIHNACIWIFSPFIEDIHHCAFFHRMPAAIFGALSTALTYRLGTLLASRRVALASALMLCFFFFPVFYSRDARFYSTLLFFTIWGTCLYFNDLKRACTTWASGLLLYIALSCTALSMLNGILFVGSVFAVTIAMLLWSRMFKDRYLRDRTQPLCVGAIASFAALLTISPFLYKYISGLSQGTIGQVGTSTTMKILPCLHDWIGKTIMGANPVMLTLSVALLLAGAAGCFKKSDHQRLVQASFLIMSSTTLLLWAGVIKNQYYFARIFYLITVFMYFHAAHGLAFLSDGLIKWLRIKRRWATFIYPTAIALLVGIHIIRYDIPAYSLDAKHKMSYKKIADWVNTTLPPGTPCLIDEAHEQRFLSGFYPIPDHPVLFAPKVKYPDSKRPCHGQPLARLVEQFPELCWIESWGSHREMSPQAAPVYQLFQNKHVISNNAIRAMTAKGIFPQDQSRAANLGNYKIRIWYNTPSDIEKAYRQAGKNILCNYPGWSIAPISRQQNGEMLYARIATDTPAPVNIQNLTNNNLHGKITIQGAVSSPHDSAAVVFTINGNKTLTTAVKPNSFWSVTIPDVSIPPSGTQMNIQIAGQKEVEQQHLFIQSIQFTATE
jgi:hypothetical protein